MGPPWKPSEAGSMGEGGARERTQFSPQAGTEWSGLCDDAVTPPATGGTGSYPIIDTSTSPSTTAGFTEVTSALYFGDGSLGTLKIPSIGLTVKVFEGTGSAPLLKGAGHFEGTSIWDGNCAIAGHNRGVRNDFGKLHTLSVGDTVTLTVTPDSGYVLDTLTVTDRRGNEIGLTARDGGKYAFTMPGRAVTVRAVFVPVQAGWSNPYSDVAPDAWCYEAVRFVTENGLMSGYGNGGSPAGGVFGPNRTLTRAQFAQILHNREGRPAVNYLMRFEDVPGEAWCAEAIRWAASQGIVGGYGNGRFGPNDGITREQLAVMLWRYAGSPAATDKELHFTDTDKASGFALEALRWAVESGVMGGYGDGRLDPKGLATRAQVAQMLKNYLEK